MASKPVRSAPGPVPVRTIAVTILMVLAAGVSVLLLYAMRHVVVWLVVAVFFAAALYPVVNWLERHLPWRRRMPATLLVFALVIVVFAGVVTLFAVPLAQQGAAFANQVPQLINDFKAHRGPIGHLLDRLHAYTWLQQNQSRIASAATGLTTPAAGILRSLALGLAGLITVFVLALLMVLEGPKISKVTLQLIDSDSGRDRLRSVVGDCARAITGYIFGNLLMSVICGLLSYLVLSLMGVPFAGLLALLVAITDLLPIVGACVGGVIAVAVASTHTLAAVIVTAIFLIAYQQVENHVLQPVILSKTVKLNPLTVVIAFVAGFELAGILGALLAIPVAGIIQVLIRDLWAHRRGATATVGDSVPAAETEHEDVEPELPTNGQSTIRPTRGATSAPARGGAAGPPRSGAEPATSRVERVSRGRPLG